MQTLPWKYKIRHYIPTLSNAKQTFFFKVVLATVMKVTKCVEHRIQGTHGCFDLDISHINPKINSEMNTICIKLNLCPSKNWLFTLDHGDFDFWHFDQKAIPFFSSNMGTCIIWSSLVIIKWSDNFGKPFLTFFYGDIDL
jgi:hypothetical protein